MSYDEQIHNLGKQDIPCLISDLEELGWAMVMIWILEAEQLKTCGACQRTHYATVKNFDEQSSDPTIETHVQNIMVNTSWESRTFKSMARGSLSATNVPREHPEGKSTHKVYHKDSLKEGRKLKENINLLSDTPPGRWG